MIQIHVEKSRAAIECTKYLFVQAFCRKHLTISCGHIDELYRLLSNAQNQRYIII